jgi:hypothetical protein
MSLMPLRRRPTSRGEEQADLPAPGPFPAARLPRDAMVIFVVILIVMAWMITDGCPVATAIETAAGAGVLSAGITARLAAAPGSGC